MALRSKNEVSVGLAEFKRAAAWTRRGKMGALDKTYLLMEEDGFTVVAPVATTKIKSVGRWEGEVAVSSLALKRLLGALPAENELKLHYFDGWLMVGKSNKISATNSFIDQAMAHAPDGELPLE